MILTSNNVKKKCPICEKEKSIATGFYKSTSPLYQDDKCVPVCIVCVKNYIVNDDGTISKDKMKTMLQRLDKPLYWDSLDSAYMQYRKEHSYLSDDEVAKNGKDIIGLYFKNIMLRQDRDKSFEDSEKDGFMHQNSNRPRDNIKKIEKMYKNNPCISHIKSEFDIGDFLVTDDIKSLFGYGYDDIEYKKMYDKYEKLKLNYSLQTNLHQEALATYVRFKVKEEDATAAGNVDEAKKWYDAAQNAAEKAKLTPKQLTQADLQGGINSFSEIFKAVEQSVEVIPILPQFKFRPNDALDFNIWCYINYARDLQGLPQCEYEDVYRFYDKKKKEYLEQYGDTYGIFDDEPTEKNRENVKKFITLPNDYEEGDE